MAHLSEIEKVAVLLIALNPEHAQRILDQLDADSLIPIIDTMKRMRRIDDATRRSVLEEVADLLDGLAKGKQPSKGQIDLLKALGPYLPETIDPGRIDWNRAGFNFDPPDEDADPQLPGGRQ